MPNLFILKEGDMKLKAKTKTIYLLSISVIVIILFSYTYLNVGNNQPSSQIQQKYTIWPLYSNSINNSVVKCIDDLKVKPSLSELQSNLIIWSKLNGICKLLYERLLNIYSISYRQGEISIPPEFLPQISAWLNNNPDLLNEVKNQHIIHIRNKFSREQSSFSPLRSRRPQSHPNNSREYVEKLVKSSEGSCDFCRVQTRTSEDIFGRIKTKYCISAANTFKVDRWHSLIIPFKHHPLKLNEQEIIDMFYAANLWFNKVNSLESIYIYPWLIWDSMPHAGASQVHPHMHVGLTPDYYVGIFENMRLGAQDYTSKFGSNFFSDLTILHSVLGLAVSFGKATAVAQLTSKKDTEVTIFSTEPGEDFSMLIFFTVTAYYEMGFYDFSNTAVFPIMGNIDEHAGSMPTLMRIVSRGDVSSVRSEISSFELFQFSNINVDPYNVIQKIKESIDRYNSNFNKN